MRLALVFALCFVILTFTRGDEQNKNKKNVKLSTDIKSQVNATKSANKTAAKRVQKKKEVKKVDDVKKVAEDVLKDADESKTDEKIEEAHKELDKNQKKTEYKYHDEKKFEDHQQDKGKQRRQKVYYKNDADGYVINYEYGREFVKEDETGNHKDSRVIKKNGQVVEKVDDAAKTRKDGVKKVDFIDFDKYEKEFFDKGVETGD